MEPVPGSQDKPIEDAVAAYAAIVRQIAHQHRLTPSDLDEIFQEMRIRLWHARERGERIEAMAASYIYRVAKTAAIDVIRRTHHGSEHTLGSTAESVAPWGQPGDAPDRAVVSAELEAQVKEGLAALSQDRRVVVQMHLAGYAQREICEMLDWPEGRTRNLLSRGLKELRAHLTARGVGPEVLA
jgi:RNA polymerase sigma-70 factor (ECF subfamily)